MEFLSQLQPWHWFVLGTGLLLLEIITPMGFFIGIGTAALVLWLLLLLVPSFPWEWQLAVFGILSVIITIAYLYFFKRVDRKTDSPFLNDRAAQLVGTAFVLSEEVSGAGAVMINDTRWQVQCEGTISQGTRVNVVGSRGMTLQIEPA